MPRQRLKISRLAKLPEECPQVGCKQRWFLECNEVATSGKLRPVSEICVAPLDPLAGSTLHGFGSQSHTCWDPDAFRRGDDPRVAGALIVGPSGRAGRL